MEGFDIPPMTINFNESLAEHTAKIIATLESAQAALAQGVENVTDPTYLRFCDEISAPFRCVKSPVAQCFAAFGTASVRVSRHGLSARSCDKWDFPTHRQKHMLETKQTELQKHASDLRSAMNSPTSPSAVRFFH